MTQVPIWCEIVCRSCAVTVAGRFVYGAVERRQMKAEAIKERWRFYDDECFCSEKCMQLYKDEQK